ncbi:hypothetical protein DBR32_05145 [Taibaiella sp. KBW10]|uniref:dioxygenase family protein n=1 Tax=Taibaiella sp. KBW10 TaxID=2153357 RepID=UPI000F591914|nr:T9SS type A sorting domain-containing protein [Taibaiella sp. KBW10]RQO31351.1 hypothetical protein DBR32_05145 [Taibaiella sp. KBW10]
MNRKEFLRASGLAGLGLSLPFTKAFAEEEPANNLASCTLIPTETAGPFPLDLTANTTFFRNDIRETQQGVQLNVKLKIVGLNNCGPMSNVRVNIWHCNKDGLYSGYDNAMNVGQAGLTYLRGYQMTDANGYVNFTTIFPGWYSGRVCHIHFQVYVSSNYAAISQFTFDAATKNLIYANNSSVYTKGADPMSIASDNIFSDGYQYQLCTLSPTSSGYEASLEVAVQGSGTTSIGNIDKETAKNMRLGQNYPNPHSGTTTIPFSLIKAAKADLLIFDLMGRKVAQIDCGKLSAGDHEQQISLGGLGLANGNYAYQLNVENNNGRYTDVKIMTFK